MKNKSYNGNFTFKNPNKYAVRFKTYLTQFTQWSRNASPVASRPK